MADLEYMNYERKIDEFLKYNKQKYRYIGHEGNEYDVVKSLFHAINNLASLTNKQILWYAAIVCLVESYQNYCHHGFLPAHISLKCDDDRFMAELTDRRPLNRQAPTSALAPCL